jgi:hypothetical protein
MCWRKIEGLPFGFEIIEDEHGWDLFRHGKFLTHAETLEEIFNVMCKFWVSKIENPAST